MIEGVSLRPRSPTEIVDAAFRVCRAHYGPLVAATAVMVAPAIALKILIPQGLPAWEALQNLLLSVTDGAVIAIVSEVYLGRTADAGTGLRAAGRRIGSLIGSSIARNILVGLGLLLLIVPGVIFFAGSFAVPMAVILEGETTGPAFSRSRDLVHDYLRHVLATLALLAVIVFGMIIGAGLALGLVAEFLGGEERYIDLGIDVVLIFLYPLFSVGGTLLYYDLRIRKEGFDLEMMASNLAGTTQSLAPAAPAPTP